MHRMRRKLEPQILPLNWVWKRAWEIASHLLKGSKNEEKVKRGLQYFNTKRIDLLCPDNSLLTHLLLAKMAANLADDIFKCISMHEKFHVSIRISIKFVHSGSIDNIPALVQIMAWRRPDDKPLSVLILTHFTDAYMRHYRGGGVMS